MATNDVIFFPLIKKGFQYSDNGGGGTQQKVTKCTTADELDDVADGEIFEWQGVETIINGTTLENGYFYKKAAGSTYTIPTGSLYFDVLSDIVTDLFTIPAGRYYQLELINLHVYGVAQNSVNGVKCSWFTNYDNTPDHVGNYVVFKNGEVTTIATLGMSGYANTDDQGNALYNASRNNFGEKNIYTFVSDAGNLADIVLVYGDDTAQTFLIGKVVNNQMCAGDNVYFNGAYYSGGKLTEDYTVDTTTYTRIDTQPRLQNITNGAGGSINIATDVNISGDLTVKGTQTVVHTEEIESENDYIELRADNPLGLASGEMSGIEVNNYDGLGTDCVLAVDATGWARVGDKNGTLQKLATIQETPTDGAFVKYNNTTKELESTSDGSALTVTFTPDISATINYIISGDTLATIAQKISKITTITPTFDANVSNPTRLQCILCNNVLFLNAYDLQFTDGLADFGKICKFPTSLKLKQEYNYGVYANTTTNNYVNTIYVSYSNNDDCFFISIRGSIGVNQTISFNMIAI